MVGRWLLFMANLGFVWSPCITSRITDIWYKHIRQVPARGEATQHVAWITPCTQDRQGREAPPMHWIVPQDHWRSQGAGGDAPPPKLGSQENSWLRRWAKYTKLCMVWQPDILNNCYELSGGCAPLNHPPGALPLDPAGGLPFPRPPVPSTSKSWLRHCWRCKHIMLLFYASAAHPVDRQRRYVFDVSVCLYVRAWPGIGILQPTCHRLLVGVTSGAITNWGVCGYLTPKSV